MKFSVEKIEKEPLIESQQRAKEMQSILDVVQIGNLLLIKNTLTKFGFEMKYIIDRENHQNAYFYATLIPEDDVSLEVFKYLKSLDVDPFFKDKNNQTCLYYACREGKLKVCEFLITECKLPINEKDSFGQIPIYYAAREGRVNVCRLLVSNGCNINLDDNYGQTCLFYAVKHNQFETVKFLVESGININKVDKMNSSALSLSEKLNDGRITQYLLENGSIRQEPRPRKKTFSSVKKVVKKRFGGQQFRKSEKQEISKEELIAAIQKPKRYVLVKISANGDKIPLTVEEIQSLKMNYPEVSKLLDDKDALLNKVSELTQDLLICESWEKTAKRLLSSLWKFRDSSIFHQPVDPMELGIPNYFNIVKHPMDFSIIKKKLRGYQYTNCKEFCSDINLVFDNCILYNGQMSPVGQLCTNVRNEFERLFDLFKMSKFM